MDVASLTIGDKTFWLAPDGDLDDLRDELTAATRAGGGFVDLHPFGRRVSLLISPGDLVFIEQRALPDDDDDDDDLEALVDQLSWIDYECDDDDPRSKRAG